MAYLVTLFGKQYEYVAAADVTTYKVFQGITL